MHSTHIDVVDMIKCKFSISLKFLFFLTNENYYYYCYCCFYYFYYYESQNYNVLFRFVDSQRLFPSCSDLAFLPEFFF